MNPDLSVTCSCVVIQSVTLTGFVSVQFQRHCIRHLFIQDYVCMIFLVPSTRPAHSSLAEST
jgi:hypothetical protein